MIEWAANHWRSIQSGLKSDRPMDVGKAITKAFLAIVIVLALLPQHTSDGSWQLRGWALIISPSNEIGDTFAGVAGVLAFLWIIVTVWLQSQELAAQRKELRLTRGEIKDQRQATQDMAFAVAEQNFDNFVFELIATHNSILNTMDIKSSSKSQSLYEGRDCFRYFYREFSKPTPGEARYPAMAQDKTLERYEQMYEKHHSDLGHYFRFVYNMLRAVSEADAVKDKHKKLIRALFSDDELLVIFYNSLTVDGENFVKYAEDFQLFDNLPQERLAKPEHKQLLPAKCFGETT
ncbi:hypothetical protein MACH17_05200 [Phaeobacter inhibens]|uniref:putative phage abortive infection protein n=1 Tax=Phaeobacter inhibens TaxID=221822 RepID=UPI0027764F8E|nr:putative phage abortive infection protein [Phaeobacter inhibens]GLO69003.1 hypothetical protein MACH17_05200 [Phaeobacter inhibens]